jgi:aspartyl-tRNA(Asn)/glutamyl-tRNA(Gln) amidotransferase subunit B
LAFLNEHKLELSHTHLTAQNICDLTTAQDSGILNSTTIKQVLNILLQKGGDVKTIIEKEGLAQISDEGGLREIVAGVLSSNPTQVEDFRGGKTKVRQFFFGEAMKATKGKANPQIINKLLDELLA